MKKLMFLLVFVFLLFPSVMAKTVTLLPTSNDVVSALPYGESTNWQCTDDDNGDTSYVESRSNIGWWADTYGHSIIIPEDANISNVTINIEVKAVGSGSKATYSRTRIKIGAEAYESESFLNNYILYWNKHKTYNTSPATGLAWTVSEVNNLKIGGNFQSAGVFTASDKTSCTYVWAVVTYGTPCIYGGSGDWNVNCSDNCVITEDMILPNNTLNLYGEGNFTILANITADKVIKENTCQMINKINDGNSLIVKLG